jgi:hypothetical protein
MITTIIPSTEGDLVFSTDASNPNGITRLDGWIHGAPMDPEFDEASNSDGDFAVDHDRRGRRVITQSGIVTSTTPEEAEDLWNEIASIQADGKPFLFTGISLRGTFTAIVTLQGSAIVDPVTDVVAQYTIQMVARDPLKYGPTIDFTPTGLPTLAGGMIFDAPAGSNGNFDFGAPGDLGRITLENPGTAEGWPVFTITGGLDTGFFLTCLETGQMLRFDRVVPAGSTVTINSKTWEVLIDDVSPWILTIDDYFSVPPKGVRTVQFNAITAGDASAQLAASLTPGYL